LRLGHEQHVNTGEKQQREDRLRVRDGFALAGAVIAFGAVVLVTLGAWKWFVRATASTVVNWPGSSWLFGVVAGAVAVFGSYGAWWLSERTAGEAKLRRAGRVVGMAVCGGAALGVVMYLFASLPGRNCRSNPDCEYIPGTGSAFFACLVTAAAVGWGLHRVLSARAEQRRARERERMRRLRKKGKGKTRKAR
jgi:hypothetical protein